VFVVFARRKSLQIGEMRMRGLEPPRGSEGVGGRWRSVANTGVSGVDVDVEHADGTGFTD
jgi:hypothetical protein